MDSEALSGRGISCGRSSVPVPVDDGSSAPVGLGGDGASSASPDADSGLSRADSGPSLCSAVPLCWEESDTAGGRGARGAIAGPSPGAGGSAEGALFGVAVGPPSPWYIRMTSGENGFPYTSPVKTSATNSRGLPAA